MAALLACVAVAVASLALPFEPAFDPWAWLVWGREVWGLDLDTSSGPSWKPLPVAIGMLLVPFGDAAPELWLVVARASFLASLVLAWRLAGRLGDGRAAGTAAGVVAAGGLVLLEDPITPWLRQWGAGLSEPILVALCLLAIDRALADRHREALAAGAGAALLRPEAWPFLAVYALWVGSRDPTARRGLALGAALVGAAWFVPDLLGAGDALEGAERARESSEGGLAAAGAAVARGLELPAAPLWGLAGLFAVVAARRSERLPLVLLGGALAWVGLVAAMAASGYAGLPRFMSPAAAVVCVLGGAGAGELAGWARGGWKAGSRGWRLRTALAGVALAGVLVAFAVPRAAELEDDYMRSRTIGDRTADLRAVAGAAGRPEPGCGPVLYEDPLAHTAIAWELDLPLTGARFAPLPTPEAGLAIAVSGGRWRASTEAALGAAVAQRGAWTAYRPCRPGPASQVSAPSSTGSGRSTAGDRAAAGVSGAFR